MVLGVAPLSAIRLPAVEFVRAAADAGFGQVGLRPLTVQETDGYCPTGVDAPDFDTLRGVLAETGMKVLDIEVCSATPALRREDWLGALGLGQALGARFLNIVGDDPDPDSLVRTVNAICADAREHGIVPILEPVAFRPLNDFDRAVRIARDAGCRVELDVLHFQRTGASLQTVRDDPAMFPVVQLCDGPARLDPADPELRELAGSDDPHDVAIAEVRDRRLLPGEGGIPIPELLAALPDSEISVEIPHGPRQAARGDHAHLADLYRSASAYLSSLTPAH
ncbi:TIM barrel protein [Pseudonocardia nematodicida]|uniref:TIM barrel protein n=1 Tax=Pseudonocardia nematodicida TaxID=1206997 RepID=A0ABV1K5A1_9PSEU